MTLGHYRPQQYLRKGYVFTGVCDSVQGGVSQHALGQTPPHLGRHPPPTATAADGTHPTGMHSISLTFGFWGVSDAIVPNRRFQIAGISTSTNGIKGPFTRTVSNKFSHCANGNRLFDGQNGCHTHSVHQTDHHYSHNVNLTETVTDTVRVNGL